MIICFYGNMKQLNRRASLHSTNYAWITFFSACSVISRYRMESGMPVNFQLGQAVFFRKLSLPLWHRGMQRYNVRPHSNRGAPQGHQTHGARYVLSVKSCSYSWGAIIISLFFNGFHVAVFQTDLKLVEVGQRSATDAGSDLIDGRSAQKNASSSHHSFDSHHRPHSSSSFKALCPRLVRHQTSACPAIRVLNHSHKSATALDFPIPHIPHPCRKLT